MTLPGVFLLAAALFVPALGQTLSIRGRVTDESGAAVSGAAIVATPAEGPDVTAKSGADGRYAVTGLSSGNYIVRASAPQLSTREPVAVAVAGTSQTLDLVLRVVLAEKQEVTVQEDAAPSVSTESTGNANAVVLKGSDLDALSDNTDDLAADLQALAGPAAGPAGGTIFIDGFSGGELPPKNAIREIRINQNPFSPEFDKLGFGRIEIFTKPGSEKFHADLGYNFATDNWNSRNPYAAAKAPFLLNELREMVSGPVGKRASFNLAVTREWVNNGNAVNTVIVDPSSLTVTPFTGTPVAELRRTVITPRFDYQINAANTLSLRYSYNRDIVRDAGTGGFNLASRGYHHDALSHTFQATETAVLSPSVINETRFQYFRPSLTEQPNTLGTSIQVLGAFNGGGNPMGLSTNQQNTFELQNNTSVLHGAHTVRFGFRLRAAKETDVSRQNFDGSFTFSGGLAPQLNDANQPVLDANGQSVMVNISSIESYRRTLLFQQLGYAPAAIRQMGGGASQFTLNTGNPSISGTQADIGVYAGDDWRLRPNLTLNLGLRYERQTNIGDATNFAPRVGIAWAPGSSARSHAKSVIRAGFGMFYDRFALTNSLTAARYNGSVLQQYLVTNPDFFPNLPELSTRTGVTASSSTIQQVSSSLRAPYLMQSAVSFEQQLPHGTTMAVTYANSHGLHLLRSRNINAPLPGTYDPNTPNSGVYPLGHPGLSVLMESSGLYNQNQIILNVNSKISSRLSLNGSYGYGRAHSNTDGLTTFPASPYSMAGEYGPAAIDLRHRVSLSGTINVKWGIRLNPLLTANSGPPFDITAGQDLYGTTLFNARPGFATDPSKPGVIATPYGLLDPNPAPGMPLVPRNYGRGPGQLMLNMRIGRTFTFGSREGRAPVSTNPGGVSTPSGGGPGRGEIGGPFSVGGSASGATAANRKYSLVASLQVRNLLNHNNPGPIIGNVTSPLFGQANQPAGSGNVIFSESANNRRLELQMRLTF